MVECKYCKGKMEKVKSKTFCFGIRVTYYCDRCHTTGDLYYKLLKDTQSGDDIVTALDEIARESMDDFFAVVNSASKKQGKCIPFMLDFPPPKTEEEKESERKWLEERKLIRELKEKFDGEILALTKRDEKVVLIAHGFTQDDLFEGISEAIKEGRYDNENECIFYE